MTYARRQRIARQLADLHEKGLRAGNCEYDSLTRQLEQADAALLRREVERIRNAKGYQFSGADLKQQLGADAWILFNPSNRGNV